MEGRSAAAALAECGIPVRLVADAAAPAMLPEVDIIVIGADRLEPGGVVNKIGSFMIALAAREYSVPVYSVCDSTKFVSAWPSNIAENRSREELWPEAPSGVDVLNRYFEFVAFGLLRGVITEDGTLSAEAAGQRAEGQRLHPLAFDALASP
jgi:methylthioribose-1-phosphate isomerase